MRILVVSHLALPHVGGVENLVDLEVRGLAALGHEVLLLTSDGGGAGHDPAYPPTVRVERVPAWHVLERRFGVPYPLFGPRLLSALWRGIDWCDAVHAHGFMFQNSALSALLAHLRGKPCVLTDHGGIQRFSSALVTFLARLGAETVGRMTAWLATTRVSYNSRVSGDLKRLSGRPVEFLPNPVDRVLFHPVSAEERGNLRRELGWPADRPKVLFVGRLIAAKGVPLLLESADPTFDLVFCGPGDTSILGPMPRPGIEYLPPRPQRDVVRLYQAADVLALPADVREGFPLVVQEATSCGLPVVLGYDPGFEPYRQLPLLFFCRRSPKSIQESIHRAMGLGMKRASRQDEFFPSQDSWGAQLVRLFGRR